MFSYCDWQLCVQAIAGRGAGDCVVSCTTMKGELAKKWLGKLTKLNAATGSGKCRGKALHKPPLLLCLIDMAEAVLIA